MSDLLEVKNLKINFKTYAGTVNAVRGVSFEINKGEILGIVGESGCGKSVTSSAIMRILPVPPAIYADGEVLLEGKDLLKLPEDSMREIRGKDISMIFQDSMSSLNPTMKIGAQIMEGIRTHNDVSKQEAADTALDLLRQVGISNPEKRFNQYPHEFSGGMRQRAMIAIALACDPKLLIADEPTTALDVTIQAQILQIMKKLTKERNTSIILITHDLGVVAETCDRVIVMYAGQVIESAEIANIFKNPMHPYTIGLLESVPSMTMNKEKVLYPIKGSPPDLFEPPVGCGFFARCDKAMKICENNPPENIEITEDDGSKHCVSCWLHHPKYKELAGNEEVRNG